MQTIYLDHNSTTPIRPEVVEAMSRCYAETYANPASQHRPGQQSRRALEDARERIAAILDADLAPPRRDRLIFTSGGTEANNLAILGIAQACVFHVPPTETEQNAHAAPLALGEAPGAKTTLPGQIIISSGEHQSVIGPAEHLLEQGWRLDTLGLTSHGTVRVDQLLPLLERFASLYGEQTCPPRLVSVQLANHETGVLQPVAELARICSQVGVPFHTDAVQAVGKLSVSFRRLGAAAMSVAAHKFGGPLGIGALIVRNDIPLQPLMFGGNQQSGLRPGTESAALAVGMATALDLWQRDQDCYTKRVGLLRDRFEAGLHVALPGIVVHGADGERLPQTSNVAFPGLDGQMLLIALDLAGVACSLGSACSSGSTELSPTLRAMDLSNDLVASSLRFSFGTMTTETEIDEAVRRIVDVCRKLRGAS